MGIEENFPIKEIRKISTVEAKRRQFYRPIYSIHKSWARRPGSTIRAIGLAHFCDEPIFNETLENSFFYQNHEFKDMIALDPFMGGGTTLVELHRLGIKTIGIDTNPVAWFTSKLELEEFNEELFGKEVKKLTETLGERILSYYRTTCPSCGNKKAEIMYTFWVRTINCPKCQQEEELFKYYIIGLKQRKNPLVKVICPECHHLFFSKNSSLNEEHECPRCKMTFVPKNGNCRNKKVKCTNCEYEFKLSDTLRKAGFFGSKQIAIEFYCSKCDLRDYKEITDDDIRVFKSASEEFEKKSDNLLYPRERLPEKGEHIANLLNHGFRYFSDLFNPRQLLCLGLLAKYIMEIDDKLIREYFVAAFSSSLEFHTVLCPYNYTMKQIVNVFNYQSFLVPTMYVENNVFGGKKGNGTFITYLNRIMKAKSYCKNPYEIAFNKDKIIKVPVEGDKIEAEIHSSFDDLIKNDGSVSLLICGSSENLKNFAIPDKSIDIIVTDPPYFDYIQYSELANFFYVWLKLFLAYTYSEFKVELISSEDEVGSSRISLDFLDGITKVFSECNRVLKDNSPLIFTFHHSSPLAWELVLKALCKSNFIVTKAFAIHSEFTARPVSGTNTDILIICRKADNINLNNHITEKKVVLYVKSEVTSITNSKESSWEELFALSLPFISSSLAQKPTLDTKLILKEIFGVLKNA
ncbi:MAG: hypothetical protein ACTSPV_10065 [Candidatus Hodarchaeales archaeon]